MLLQLGYQRTHLGRAQNTQRTARQLAARHEIQRGQSGRLNHFFERILLQQIVRQPDVVGHLQHLVQRRPS